MNIVFNKPPLELYEKAHAQFGVEWDVGVAFTVDDTIYSKYTISPDLLAHEEVHERQQRVLGVQLWWEKYFSDSNFRLQQELEAYREQYLWIVRNIKDKNQRFRKLHFIATKLSGTMYGGIISYTDAVTKIKNASSIR